MTWYSGMGLAIFVLLVFIFVVVKDEKKQHDWMLTMLCIVPFLTMGLHHVVTPQITAAEMYYNSLDLEVHYLQFEAEYRGAVWEPDAFALLKQNEPEKALQAWQIYLILDEKYSRQMISQAIAENKIRGDFLEMLPEMIKWKETVAKQ